MCNSVFCFVYISPDGCVILCVLCLYKCEWMCYIMCSKTTYRSISVLVICTYFHDTTIVPLNNLTQNNISPVIVSMYSGPPEIQTTFKKAVFIRNYEFFRFSGLFLHHFITLEFICSCTFFCYFQGRGTRIRGCVYRGEVIFVYMPPEHSELSNNTVQVLPSSTHIASNDESLSWNPSCLHA